MMESIQARPWGLALPQPLGKCLNQQTLTPGSDPVAWVGLGGGGFVEPSVAQRSRNWTKFGWNSSTLPSAVSSLTTKDGSA